MTGVRTIVFLVGCPRSGTTLLQQMLNVHPDIYIGPETFFFRNFWLGREADYRSPTSWARLVHELAASPGVQDAGIPPGDIEVAVTEAARTPVATFRALLELFSRRQGAPVVGDKTPNHVLHISSLRSWFPEARFIHLVRDPRAVVNSWRTVPWSSGWVVGDAALWHEYVSAADLDLGGEVILTARYEALVEESEAELRRICGFLDVEYDPAMLRHDTRPAAAVDPEREPWKQGALEAVSGERVEAWRRELTTRQVRAIEATVGRLMEAYGYHPMTASTVRPLTGPVLRTAAAARRRLAGLRPASGS